MAGRAVPHRPTSARRANAIDTNNIFVFGVGLLGVGALMAITGLGVQNPFLSASGAGWVSVGILTTVVGFDRSRYPLLNPLLLWGLSLLFGSALRPLYLMTLPAQEQTEFLAGISSESVVQGSVLNVVFLVFGLVGYIGVRRRRNREGVISPEYFNRSMWLFAAVTSVIGLVAFVLYLRAIGLGFSDLGDRLAAKRRVEIGGQLSSVGNLSWINAVPMFGGLLMLFLWSNGVAKSKYAYVFIGVSFVVGLAVPLINGSRDGLVQPLLLAILVASDFGRRLNVRHLMTVLVVATVLVVVFGALRDSGSNELDAGSFDAVSVVDSLLGTHNWAGAEKTAIVAQRVPENLDHQWGTTYATAVVAPVPRSIWNEKPVVRIGPLVGEEIFLLDRDGRTGVPPGAPGELFLNFGLAGIPLGGLIFGALAAATYKRFERFAKSDFRRVIYAVLLVNIGLKFPGGDFAGVYTEMLMSTLILTALSLVWRRASRVRH